MQTSPTTTRSNASQHRLLAALSDAADKLKSIERERAEPIAIVGMACRFPGGASDPETFWNLLQCGKDAIVEVPPQRWDVDAYYDPDPECPNKMYTRHGGFLMAVDQFDADFFGISPREAISVDPQQRILLEVGWEALESAGLTNEALEGSQTGVYVGITTNDYGRLLSAGEAPLDAYFASGNSLNAAAGRLSYFLGLHGPSMAIDTACSSSLVAVHLACQSLRSGECRTALAGGVNLLLSPEVTVAACRTKMLSADGRCKTFDDAADGYVRSEGCGVVVLKRLTHAVHDGDRILALIRGSAVNQDGASSGLTVPNGPAQRALIRDAIARAGIEPGQISYVEAHGTGTALGDPIEIGALAAELGDGRNPARPLLVGSVKTNIGHLESAAGIAGLIKVVLAMQHETIPPHLHLQKPTRQIPWDKIPIRVPTELTSWDCSERVRIAGVSSFGFSGTNAHVILEQAPSTVESTDGAPMSNGESSPSSAAQLERPWHLLTLAAKTEPALRDLAGRIANHIAVHPEVPLADVCFTGNRSRSKFQHRLALPVESPADAQRSLEAFNHRQPVGQLSYAAANRTGSPKFAFLFSGQGSQAVNMGRQLFDTQPTFRQTMQRCDEVLRPHLDTPLLDVLYPNQPMESSLDETRYAQPALFALEYALFELWKSWGVRPAVVLGHSVGEYVAACVAGVFGLEDGLRLVAQRGRLMQEMPRGEMLAVFTSEQRVVEAIRAYDGAVAVAALNGPKNVVISGPCEPLRAIAIAMRENGIRSKRLAVSHAFHSPMMRPVRDRFFAAAQAVRYSPPAIDLIANVTGELAGSNMATADYWAEHLLCPVRFADGFRTLCERSIDAFIELGPHAILLALGRECVDFESAAWLPSVRKEHPEWPTILQSLAELYVRGFSVDWPGFDKDYRRHLVSLPTYPWQKTSYWVESARADERHHQINGQAKLERFHKADTTHELANLLKSRGRLTSEQCQLLPDILAALDELDHEQPPDSPVDAFMYEVQWRERPCHGRPTAPLNFLLPVAEIQQRIAPSATAETQMQVMPAYAELLSRLEEASLAYAVDALRSLGLQFEIGDRFTLQELVSRFNVVDQHRQLLRRLIEMTVEARWVRLDGLQWEVVRIPDLEKRASADELLARYPFGAAEITLTTRCGSRLADVLRGECDPLQLIFPWGDLTTTTNLYRESPAAVAMNGLLCDTVQLAIERRPQQRELRILEIGAGTGGTTSYVLPILRSGATEYIYTDISSYFRTAAEQWATEYPFVRFQSLDIESSPGDQGFAEARFDLVIAANVLHATAELARTLQNTAALLAPGGMLVLLETTAKQRWVDLIFGMTEGWWRFSDHHVRRDNPLVSSATWQELLMANGFDDVATIGPPGAAQTVLSHHSVIVARKSPVAAPPQTDEASHWLIFADGDGTGERLAQLASENGEQCTLVYRGSEFQETDRGWHLNVANSDDYEQLLRRVADSRMGLPMNVVHLWSLDSWVRDDFSSADFDEAFERGVGSVHYLVQALAKRESAGHNLLTLVTRGAQPGDKLDFQGLSQSPLWGMAKCIALEYPELNCVRVDLELAGGPKQTESLYAEIRSSRCDEEVVYRDVRRLVPHLIRASTTEGDERTPSPKPFLFRRDGTYLITGGLGGVGLAVAKWMVQRGARHLLLMGRAAVSDGSEHEIELLKSSGADIIIERADVAQRAEVDRVFRYIDRAMPTLRGIMHCAGVLDDGVLAQQDWNRFKKVMAPKVAGAWNLHRAAQNLSLDCFVLFSSAASLLGSQGQANHAAANAMLDQLAWLRSSQGLPGLSINWGPWVEVGAVARMDRRHQVSLIEKGVSPLTTRQALAALEHAMRRRTAQVAVLPVDWDIFTSKSPGAARTGLIVALKNQRAAPGSESQNDLNPALRLPYLKAASRDDRESALVAYLQEQVADILRWNQSGHPSPEQPLNEIGLDSLMSTILRNRVVADLQVDISMASLLGGICIRRLAADIGERLASNAEQSHDGLGTTDAALCEHVEELTI